MAVQDIWPGIVPGTGTYRCRRPTRTTGGAGPACWPHVGRRGDPGLRTSEDTQALLDTGSVVTLFHPELAGGKKGEPLEVACVHGDTRTYGTCHVVIRTPHGVFTARAVIVPHLPVPLLIGRDCPIFHRLWNPEREAWAWRNLFHRGEWKVRPAYGATRVPRTPEESTAEDQGSEGSGPSPPDLTRPTTRGVERTARTGEFASAQLQDEALKHAWSHVLAHDRLETR